MQEELKFRCWRKDVKAFSKHMNAYALSRPTNLETTASHLMQDTGLVDINGVSVYEGDIVYSHIIKDLSHLIVGGVVYDEEKDEFASKNDIGLSPMSLLKDFEVCGHIYDDSEHAKWFNQLEG